MRGEIISRHIQCVDASKHMTQSIEKGLEKFCGMGVIYIYIYIYNSETHYDYKHEDAVLAGILEIFRLHDNKS